MRGQKWYTCKPHFIVYKCKYDTAIVNITDVSVIFLYVKVIFRFLRDGACFPRLIVVTLLASQNQYVIFSIHTYTSGTPGLCGRTWPRRMFENIILTTTPYRAKIVTFRVKRPKIIIYFCIDILNRLHAFWPYPQKELLVT